MASFQSEFYDPATAPVDRSRRRLRRSAAIASTASSLPGDAPTDEALARLPAAGQPAAAVSRRAERLRRDAEGRLPAAARDGLRDQRADDVPRRRRTVPESRADQHDGGLRLQPAAVGDADGHQRQRRRARRRRDAELPARDGACSRRTSPTRRRGRGTPRSIASCRGSCAARSRTSAARRRTSSARATSTSCSRARFRRTRA